MVAKLELIENIGWHRLIGWIGGGLIVLGFLADLHFYPWGSYYNELLPVVGCLLIGLKCVVFRPDKVPFSFILGILFFCLTLIQWVCGNVLYFGDAYLVGLYFLGFAVAAYFGASSVGTKINLVGELALVFLFSAILSGYVAMSQWLDLSNIYLWRVDVPPGLKPYANIAQPNNLASLLVVGFVSLVYFKLKHVVSPAVFWCMAPIMLLMVALPASRTTLVQYAVIVVLLVYWGWSGVLEQGEFKRLVGLVLVGGCIWLCMPSISELLLLSGEGRKITQELVRPLIWKMVISWMGYHPVLGSGWLQFGLLQTGSAMNFPATPYFEYAHNIVLDFLVADGLVFGSLAAILCLAWWLLGVGRAKDFEVVYSLLVISVLLTHAMLEFPLYYAYFLAPVGFLVGVVDGRLNRCVTFVRVFLIGRLLYCVFFVAMVILVIDYAKLESHYRSLRFASAGLGGQVAPVSFYALSQWEDFFEFTRMLPEAGLSSDEIFRAKRVADRFPFPPAMFKYSMVLALNGRAVDAKEEILRIRKMHGEKRYQEALDAVSSKRDSASMAALWALLEEGNNKEGG